IVSESYCQSVLDGTFQKDVLGGGGVYATYGTVPADLPSSYLNAKIFHFICSSIWASQHVTDILRLRDKRLPPPIFVWEPIPESASKENIQSCIEAMKMVDVVSPNHEEAAALLGLIAEDEDEDEKFLAEEMLICMADKFLKYQIGPHGNGCVVIRASYKEIIPAYWTALKDGNRNPHVVDVTGAGNAFCGGFMVGLLRSNFDVFEAALYGSVSASFTVEQLGTPRLGFDERGNEIWNSGDSPSVRLQKLRLRVKEKLKEVLKVKLKERIHMKKMQINDHNGINTTGSNVKDVKDGADNGDENLNINPNVCLKKKEKEIKIGYPLLILKAPDNAPTNLFRPSPLPCIVPATTASTTTQINTITPKKYTTNIKKKGTKSPNTFETSALENQATRAIICERVITRPNGDGRYAKFVVNERPLDPRSETSVNGKRSDDSR
ncbi:4543_t:CDS:2, partial [Racocetra fulgida]